MKKTLLFVALTFVSASAFASKARVAALGSAMTAADDVQNTFTNPAKMFGFGDLLTMEYGTAGNEEGGIFRSHGDAKWGVYMGHKSANFADLTTAATNAGVTVLTEQNPIEFFYGQKGGDMRWGASLIYSNAENKTANTKTSTMGVRLGAATDVWEAFASIGLGGEAKNATQSAKNDLGLLVGGQYAANDVLYYGSYDSSSAKIATGASDLKVTNSVITVGAESKMKGDASHFFYGVKYVMTNKKVDTTPESKITKSQLPLYAGVEADAASWLVLRGSVQQSVLVNSNKVEGTALGTAIESTGLTDTAATLGAGFKFGKLWIDTSLTAGGDGKLNSSDIGSQASLNYTW